MIQEIEANGINVTYKFDGPADAPVVMLSNSLMSNHTMWDPQMAVLTESFRVLRYDTRGHGDTDAPARPVLHQTAGRRCDSTARHAGYSKRCTLQACRWAA